MKLFNIQVHELERWDAHALLSTPQVIFTPNPEILLEARKNKAFHKALQEGTLMLPDGHGLLLVSTLLKIKSKLLRASLYLPALLLFLIWKRPFLGVFPEVVHGCDFMAGLIKWAADHDKSVFFLGGRGGVPAETARWFKITFTRLKIAGFSTCDPSEEAFELVKASKANVVLVAYGAPKQELWIAKYHKKLPDLVHIMGVGGSFDFWCGDIKRAPLFIQKLGLEWFWRLCLDPLKRAKRIWNATVKFPFVSLFFSD